MMTLIQLLLITIACQVVGGFHLPVRLPSVVSNSIDKHTATTQTYLPKPNNKLVVIQLSKNSHHNDDQSITNPDDDKLIKKVEGRKKRVIAGYKITSLSYLILSLIITAKSRILYYSGGPLLIATLSYILTDAATHNRLSSDTYKRLNLALGTSILISSIGSVLMRSFSAEVLIAFIGIVNTVKGYGYGLKSWELNNNACALDDVMKGMKSSIGTMTKVPNLNSALYLISTVIVSSMTTLKIIEIAQLALGNSKGFHIGTRLYRLAKLILMSVVSFTLKDAADRDRLEGTTFIELNYLISFIFATLSGKSILLYKNV
jgi:hypothetical protein